MKLSAVIPVYNEEKTVSTLLSRLTQVSVVKEILVINDGSTDSTKKILQGIRHPKIKIYHQKNHGKGHAVRKGLSLATGELVLIQDADLEYDPQDIIRLYRHALKKNTSVVYGSRFLGKKRKYPFVYKKFNEFLNWFTNFLYNSQLTDMETCYKLLPTSLMKSLKLQTDGFEIDPEITCRLLKRNIPIFEVPIKYTPRSTAEGKKITWVDAIKVVKQVLIERVTV